MRLRRRIKIFFKNKQYNRLLKTVMNSLKFELSNPAKFRPHVLKHLDNNIKHQFTYPKSPKINGVVERFNRIIQEEFINKNDEIYYDLNKFEIKLKSYLNWYNYKRPHASLNYLSPIQFIKTINFLESECL